MRLTPRTLGAGLGLVAAAATLGVIASRLIDGTAPRPTPVWLSSSAPTPVAVESLRVGEHGVLTGPWTLAPAASAASAAHVLSSGVALPVGRGTEVRAALSSPREGGVSCRAEPRPFGACVLRVSFQSSTDMRCDFECPAEPARP